ncbi:hypothetical protein HIM_04901 [Hirsutella minnesotensis 3608]|uniref:Uncharacterized protein n=1 Tax=Hirsutella minnesotensis 3608 TaxID=1043627 RepID=A0A0F8A5Q6_9HYPO|nr:hypothetical protein HIM_04901 [Hirsutella minnesotensis 3608]
MLARAKRLPRICLRCRFDLAPRKATVGPVDTWTYRTQSQRFASDAHPDFRSESPKSSTGKHRQDGKVRMEPIGRDVYGQPLNALVVEDLEELPRRHKRSSFAKHRDSLSPKDVKYTDSTKLQEADTKPIWNYESLESITTESSLEVVEQTFEWLRPRNKATVGKQRWEELVETIQEGFTELQLQQFLEHKNIAEKGDDAPLYPWLTDQAAWTSSVTSQTTKTNPKRRLAARIVREVWNIQVGEEVSQGSMVVRLRPDVFELISYPSINLLHSLEAEMPDGSGAPKIELVRKSHRMGIIGSRAAAFTILERIDQAVRSLRTKTISLKRIRNSDLPQRVLNELEHTTGTMLKHNAQDLELDITWIAQDVLDEPDHVENQDIAVSEARDGPKEGPPEIVLRLLAGRQEKCHESVQMIRSEGQEQHDVFITRWHREIQSQCWWERAHSWSRCITPDHKVNDNEIQSQQFDSETASLPRLLREAKDSLSRSRVVATFGHILHLAPASLAAARKKGHTRVLSTIVPHPAALTPLSKENESSVTQTTEIVMQFSPDPMEEDLDNSTAPRLQLRLPVALDSDLSTSAIPHNASIEAVIPRKTSDILLPDELVDVRVTQHQILPLNADTPSIKDFLSMSEFDILEGRFSTPSHVRISMPAGEAGQSPTSQDVEVPYIFTGLEIHQMVETGYEGFVLRHNSIEAGQYGGQRQELCLIYSVERGIRVAKAKSQEQMFLLAAKRIASGTAFPWHGGQKLLVNQLPDMDRDWDPIVEELDPKDNFELENAPIKGLEPKNVLGRAASRGTYESENAMRPVKMRDIDSKGPRLAPEAEIQPSRCDKPRHVNSRDVLTEEELAQFRDRRL